MASSASQLSEASQLVADATSELAEVRRLRTEFASTNEALVESLKSVLEPMQVSSKLMKEAIAPLQNLRILASFKPVATRGKNFEAVSLAMQKSLVSEHLQALARSMERLGPDVGLDEDTRRKMAELADRLRDKPVVDSTNED